MKNVVFRSILSALLAVSLVFGGCQSTGSAQDKKPAEVTEEKETEEETASVEVHDQQTVFGEFTTYTQEGEEVNQDIFAEADLTMVNIWGTFCGPCLQEMPYLEELANEYAEKNVAIVGIISDVYEPENAEVQDVIDATGAKYMQLIHSEDLYNNFLRMVQAVPTTVFVNSEGMRVGDVLMGARDKETWIAEIEARLEAVADEEADE